MLLGSGGPVLGPSGPVLGPSQQAPTAVGGGLVKIVAAPASLAGNGGGLAG